MPRSRNLLLRRSTSSIFEPLENRRLMSAGALDPSFSGDGMATVDFGGGIVVNATATTVQADGKTVVVGNTSDHRVAVARFNVDGTLDATFGPNHNGKVLSHIGGANYQDQPLAVLIDQNANILVGGYARVSVGAGLPYDTHAMVVRYLSNGTIDSSFGKDASNPGAVVTDFGEDPYCEITDMTTAANGKILIGGEAYPDTFTNMNQDMVVARLNSDGTADGSFGDGGHRFMGFGDSEEGDAITIDNSGTPQTNPRYGAIIIVGKQGNNDAFDDEVRIAVGRLTPNGNFDNSFDGDGRKTLTIPGEARAAATGVFIESNSRIVISGTVAGTVDSNHHSHNQDFALVRLLANGAIDTSFGGNGTGEVITNISGEDIAFDMIQSCDGELLVGGQSSGHVAVAKFTLDGALDPAFGANGVVVGETGAFTGLALGPGKRFVATGGSAFHTDRFLDTGANLVYATAFLNPSTTEGSPTPATFFVFRSERLPVATRVYLQVGGTATSPLSFPFGHADYTGISAPPPPVVFIGPLQAGVAAPMIALPGGNTCYVDIPANQTYATVTITAIDDMRVEGDETATFSVLANANYDLGTPNTATITIHDNDGAVLRDNADAYVRDGASANTNFGSATDIEVKKNMTGVNRQSYIKFDLTSVSAANIGSIQLRLYGSLNNANQQNVATGVFGSNNTTWSENAITWNNKPGTNTIALASATIINTTPQWYTWDITAYAKSQLALGHKTITLVLQNSATSDPFATFASKESSSLGPQLVVAFA